MYCMAMKHKALTVFIYFNIFFYSKSFSFVTQSCFLWSVETLRYQIHHNLTSIILSCRFNHHLVKLECNIRSDFRCNSTWESFKMGNLSMWLSLRSTTKIILRRTWRESPSFRLISMKIYTTSIHYKGVSPREFCIPHKADGEVNYYLKLNL